MKRDAQIIAHSLSGAVCAFAMTEVMVCKRVECHAVYPSRGIKGRVGWRLTSTPSNFISSHLPLTHTSISTIMRFAAVATLLSFVALASAQSCDEAARFGVFSVSPTTVAIGDVSHPAYLFNNHPHSHQLSDLDNQSRLHLRS